MTTPTTPPTAADVDEWWLTTSGGAAQAVLAFVGQCVADQAGGAVTQWAYGWTRFDGSPAFHYVAADPTSDPEAGFSLQGLLAVYGAVTVREYTYAIDLTTQVMSVAGDTEQARVNDPANWVPVP